MINNKSYQLSVLNGGHSTPEIKDALKKGLEDEIRHAAWLDSKLEEA